MNLIIPQTLKPIAHFLETHVTTILTWGSHQIYDQLCQRHEKHPLMVLWATLDFRELEKACQDYHLKNGKGRGVAYGVDTLLKIIFLRYYGGHSLRDTVFQVETNMLYKFFVGLHLWETAPSYVTLSLFETYLMEKEPRLFFDEILRQIDEWCPEDKKRIQIGDTYAMLANAAEETLIRRLQHCHQMVLRFLKKSEQSEILNSIETDKLLGSKEDKKEQYLSKTEKSTRLTTTIQASNQLLKHPVVAESEDEEIRHWVAIIEKIIADELAITQNDQAEITAVTLLPDNQRGSYRICSATDPDATIRNHGEGKKDFGYNVSLVTTTHFVREIQVDTGSRPDPEAIPEMLASQKEHHGFYPEKLVYDQAAGDGKHFATVEETTHKQTQLVVYPKRQTKSDEKFTPQHFSLSEDGNTLTCPNGRISTRRYRHGKGEGHTFRFVAPQCVGCPLLKPCRGLDPKATPTNHRNVYISDYTDAYLRAVAYSKTDSFKQDMKLRPHVERIIAGVTRFGDGRHARFRGEAKCDFQAKMNGMGYNAKQLARHLTPKAHPPTLPTVAFP